MLKTIHLAVVFITIFAVLYSDEQALSWLLGKKERLSAETVRTLHAIVSIGLGLLIITGGLLYMRAPSAYLSSPTFLVKMAAIIALIINTYVIERLSPLALSRSYASLSDAQRRSLFISGAVSVAGWATTVLCGYLLA